MKALYKIIRFFLFKFNPEFIHDVLIWKLSLPFVPGILKWFFKFENKQLEKNYLGIHFKNPLGLAAGFDKNAKALLAWQALGFGFVEVGTVTPKPQAGNPKPRISRFEKEESLVNWMGFPNDGIDKVLERIKKTKPKLTIPVGLNIGKNKETPLEKAADDYAICIEKANHYIDFFVINISSPNTPELRRLGEPQYLGVLLAHLQKISKKPLFLKLSPDLKNNELANIVYLCKRYGVKGLVIANTTTDYSLLPGTSQGGVSGKVLREKSTYLLEKAKSIVSYDMVIMGVGGIFSIEDVQTKFHAGANLVEVYTGFIFEGPGLIKSILKAL